MKVILLENIKRIGSIGEVIEVKRGFARNFLIANKKALYASKENIKEVEKIKADLSKKDNEKKAEAQKISEQISGRGSLPRRRGRPAGLPHALRWQSQWLPDPCSDQQPPPGPRRSQCPAGRL